MTTLTTAYAAVRHVQSLLAASTAPRRIALLSSRIAQARLCEAALQEHLPLSSRAHEVQNYTPTSFAHAVAENARITLPAARVNEPAYAALLRQALISNSMGLEAPFMRPPHDPLRHMDAIHAHFEALASRGVTPQQYVEWMHAHTHGDSLTGDVHAGLARGYGHMWSRVFTGRAMSHGWLAFSVHMGLGGETSCPPLDVAHVVCTDAQALTEGTLRLLRAAVERTQRHADVRVCLFSEGMMRAAVPPAWRVVDCSSRDATSEPVHAALQRFAAAGRPVSAGHNVTPAAAAQVDDAVPESPILLKEPSRDAIAALRTPHAACIRTYAPIDALVHATETYAQQHGPTHVLVVCRNARAARQAAVQLEARTAASGAVRVTLHTRAVLRNVPSVRVALCAAAIAAGLHTDAHAHTLITSSVYGMHPHMAAQIMQSVKHSREMPQPFFDRLQRISERSILLPDADVTAIVDAFVRDTTRLTNVWRNSGVLTRVCESFVKVHEFKLEHPDALAQLLSILHDIETRSMVGGVMQVWEVLDEALRDATVHSEDVDDASNVSAADASMDAYGLMQLARALIDGDGMLHSDGVHAYPHTHVHVSSHSSSLPRAHSVILYEPNMPGTAAPGTRIPACDVLYAREDAQDGKRSLWTHALSRASHNVLAITTPHALTRRARFLDETFGKLTASTTSSKQESALNDTCVVAPAAFSTVTLPHMSVSRMQQYLNCGWAYHLHRNTGIRAHAPGERHTLMYGTGMHACVALLGCALAHSFTHADSDARALDTLCAALVQSYAREPPPAEPDEVPMSRNARFEALQAHGDMAAAFARAGAALHMHVHVLSAQAREEATQRVCDRLNSVAGHMMDAFTLACARDDLQDIADFPVGAACRVMRPAGVTSLQWEEMCSHAGEHVRVMIQRECDRVRAGLLPGAHSLSIPVLIEHAFEVQAPAGTVLRGVWDRVDVGTSLAGGLHVCIREFKSGSHTHAPSHMQTHGKVYARVQMHTYAAALSRWMASHVPSIAYNGSVALESIETGESVNVLVDPRSQERAWARLEETAASIRAGKFEPHPSRQICSGCEYNDTCAFAWGVDAS